MSKIYDKTDPKHRMNNAGRPPNAIITNAAGKMARVRTAVWAKSGSGLGSLVEVALEYRGPESAILLGSAFRASEAPIGADSPGFRRTAVSVIMIPKGKVV